MKLFKSFFLFFAFMASVSCATKTYKIGEKAFGSADAAIAHAQSELDWVLETVDPLDAPIGGPAVIVIPTQSQLEQAIRGQYSTLR